MSALAGLEAIHVATVLEDCVDQLAILGRIMPASYEERGDASEVGTWNWPGLNYRYPKFLTFQIEHIFNQLILLCRI